MYSIDDHKDSLLSTILEHQHKEHLKERLKSLEEAIKMAHQSKNKKEMKGLEAQLFQIISEERVEEAGIMQWEHINYDEALEKIFTQEPVLKEKFDKLMTVHGIECLDEHRFQGLVQSFLLNHGFNIEEFSDCVFSKDLKVKDLEKAQDEEVLGILSEAIPEFDILLEKQRECEEKGKTLREAYSDEKFDEYLEAYKEFQKFSVNLLGRWPDVGSLKGVTDVLGDPTELKEALVSNQGQLNTQTIKDILRTVDNKSIQDILDRTEKAPDQQESTLLEFLRKHTRKITLAMGLIAGVSCVNSLRSSGDGKPQNSQEQVSGKLKTVDLTQETLKTSTESLLTLSSQLQIEMEKQIDQVDATFSKQAKAEQLRQELSISKNSTDQLIQIKLDTKGISAQEKIDRETKADINGVPSKEDFSDVEARISPAAGYVLISASNGKHNEPEIFTYSETPLNTVEQSIENDGLLLRAIGTAPIPGSFTDENGNPIEGEVYREKETGTFSFRTAYEGKIRYRLGVLEELAEPYSLKPEKKYEWQPETEAFLKSLKGKDPEFILASVKEFIDVNGRYSTSPSLYDTYVKDMQKRDQYKIGKCDQMNELAMEYLKELGFRTEFQHCYRDDDGVLVKAESHAISRVLLPNGQVRYLDATPSQFLNEEEAKAWNDRFPGALENSLPNELLLNSDVEEILNNSLTQSITDLYDFAQYLTPQDRIKLYIHLIKNIESQKTINIIQAFQYDVMWQSLVLQGKYHNYSEKIYDILSRQDIVFWKKNDKEVGLRYQNSVQFDHTFFQLPMGTIVKAEFFRDAEGNRFYNAYDPTINTSQSIEVPREDNSAKDDFTLDSNAPNLVIGTSGFFIFEGKKYTQFNNIPFSGRPDWLEAERYDDKKFAILIPLSNGNKVLFDGKKFYDELTYGQEKISVKDVKEIHKIFMDDNGNMQTILTILDDRCFALNGQNLSDSFLTNGKELKIKKYLFLDNTVEFENGEVIEWDFHFHGYDNTSEVTYYEGADTNNDNPKILYKPLTALSDYISPLDPLYDKLKQSGKVSGLKAWDQTSVVGEFINEVLNGNYNQVDLDVGIDKKLILYRYQNMCPESKTILFHRLVNNNSPLLAQWLKKKGLHADKALKDIPIIRQHLSDWPFKMKILVEIMEDWRDTPDW